MADTEENQTDQNNPIGVLDKSFEAEDIVADAIKLNVDEDLNEQKYDISSQKSSSFQNGNPNSLDNANIEDEPNYEIDENDEEQYLNEQNEQSFEEQNNENIEQNEATESSIMKSENNDPIDDNTTTASNENNKKSENDKNQDGKTNENKTNDESQKDEQSIKDNASKKESSTNESDSKASKSKSSSTKDRDASSDRKSSSSSNDKSILISGLSSSVKASDLENLFKKYGKVISETKIMKLNTKGSGSKLYGIITMENAEQAAKCIQNLNKTEFEGRTITVEKNKIKEKKSDGKDESKDKKDADKSKRDRTRSRSRSKSPIYKHRGIKSPIRRFPLHRPGGFRRVPPPFGFRRGGFGGGPRPFMSNEPLLPPMVRRKFEVERLMHRREIRVKELRRAEDYRRQRDIERRQQEERDKLEREKLRLKIERERLEREKSEFLRAEREKARIERERVEREREELRRKQTQLPSIASSRLDDSRSGKRSYDDLYGGSSTWDSGLDRKRNSGFPAGSTAALAASTRYDDLEPALSGNGFSNFPTYNLLSSSADLIERRKLDVGLAASSNLRDSNRSSSGYDRDDRRQTTNGLGSYNSATRSSLSSRDRETRRDRDDWKNPDSRRTDSRFLDNKNSLTQQAATPSSYLSNTARSYDSWTSAPDRMPPASSLKFSSYASVSGIDRNRVAPLSQNVQSMGSTIGLYNPPPMGGLLSNYTNNNNLNSGHRRY